MNTEQHAHRFADIILNSDYELRTEIEGVVKTIQISQIESTYSENNILRVNEGKKSSQGKQSSWGTWGQSLTFNTAR